MYISKLFATKQTFFGEESPVFFVFGGTLTRPKVERIKKVSKAGCEKVPLRKLTIAKLLCMAV